MGNLNDPLVSGDQKSGKEDSTDSGESKPSINPSLADLATFQRAHMEKTLDRDDENTIEINELGKAPDKTSVVYAPKKRFLKDYKIEGSASVDALKSSCPQEKVCTSSNDVFKQEANNIGNITKGSIEMMNISSCIGVIVESELMKYEMNKDNSENLQCPEKCLLPLLFAPYNDQMNEGLEDRFVQKSQSTSNQAKEKSYARNATKSIDSPNAVKHDVEITNCYSEMQSQQRHDRGRSNETDKNNSTASKSKNSSFSDATVANKRYSPKLFRASPMNVALGPASVAPHPLNSQALDEWRVMVGSDKSGHLYQNLAYGAKQFYADHKLSKIQDVKAQSHVQFKTPPDPNYRRTDVQISPKLLSRRQSPREALPSETTVPFGREDFYGYSRGFDPRLYQNSSVDKYALCSSRSSPQTRTTADDSPIDLRVKKKDKSSLGYVSAAPFELPSDGKRMKFHNSSYDQPVKTSGQYYYLPAENEKSHHPFVPTQSSSLPYGQNFLKSGEGETLKSYLSDHYGYPFGSRHSEAPLAKTKQPHPDGYRCREGYGKIHEENLAKPQQTFEKWERGSGRGGEQGRSRRHHESYEQDSPGNHYFKYFEPNKNQDPKSSSPHLIPLLFPISAMSHSRSGQPHGYFPSHEAQNFQCKLCNSVHSSYRSFRLHIVKDHNLEPHPEHYSQLSTDGKGAASYATERVFPTHKTRQESEGYHLIPKQVAEVYPIISKVSPAHGQQTGTSAVDQADAKSKSVEKSKSKVKPSSNKEGFEDLRQVLSWDCRHQLSIDSEMNCTTCMEGFQDITDWRTHISSMHMVRSCACRTCNKWFANAEELNKHLQVVHAEHRQVDVEYRCLYCRKAFTDEEVLYVHTREHERALSISRAEGKAASRGGTEIQKAVPDTTCPESDQKASSDSCDVASTISPASDYDQERPTKVDETKFVGNVKVTSDGDLAKLPSSKKSFFLKKFQLEEMGVSSDAESSKAKFGSASDPSRPNERTTPIFHPGFMTARSLIDSLVTEGVAGFNKPQTFGLQPNVSSEFGNSGETKSSQDANGQSSEFLLGAASTDHPQKQPLLKDMLLQINSKTHFPFNAETAKSNSSQPRTKCVRDICDEIIAHSFRESSPVGSAERLKIFDSISFDVATAKAESPPGVGSDRRASATPTKASADATRERSPRDVRRSRVVDSSDVADDSARSSVSSDSRKSSESPEIARRSTSPTDRDKASNDPDADSTSKTVAQKESRTCSTTQGASNKRDHVEDLGDRPEVKSDEPACRKNGRDDADEEEPPCKKKR